MTTTRRDMLKLGALAGTAGLAAKAGLLAAGDAPIGRAEKPLRILILGGTGFTGPHQVRYALARGHKLTLFNRGRRPQDWPVEVEELTGDRETGDISSLAGREWDVCIDNPTSVPHWVRDVGQVLKGKVGHYIYISSISAYADARTPDQDEDAATAPYAGPDIMAETRQTLIANMGQLYGPMKAGCEREAEKWFPGITTVIRPGLIVGPGDETDRFTYWPLRMARGGDAIAPGSGEDPTQVIDARDLAEWTIRMAESRSFGKYNATGPDYLLTMAAMLHGIRAVTTAGTRLHWLPFEFLREHNVSAWSDLPAWMPPQGESGGLARVQNKRAVDKGLTFRPLAATAADTLAWFGSLPAERQAQLRAGLKPEREAEVLAAWRARSAG